MVTYPQLRAELDHNTVSDSVHKRQQAGKVRKLASWTSQVLISKEIVYPTLSACQLLPLKKLKSSKSSPANTWFPDALTPLAGGPSPVLE
jgi:hypothetical protein